MKRAFLILTIFLSTYLNAFSLKDKIIKGNPGDFVVTEQAGTYTVLIIRSLTDRYLLLEEIDVPTMNHNPQESAWKTWIGMEAPGHTAWVSYLIDLDNNKLLESYSFTKRAWLYADDPNNFLARLLTLNLEKTPADKRKKIGPTPAGDEDHRAIWNPSVTFEGKQQKSPITAWSTRWPKDNSIISGCEIEVYFSSFAFPYWIEVKSPHYKASIRTLDSGCSMSSPQSIVFQQSPFFIGGNQLKNDAFEVHIHCPLYYSELRLYALDLSAESHPLIEISTASAKKGPELTLQIPERTLEAKLMRGHYYRWVLIPTAFPSTVIHADTPFEW